MRSHSEANETLADEIQEHGHPPTAAEEAAEASNARSQRSPAQINADANAGHEKMRRAADGRSNHPGEGIKEHGLHITSRTTGRKVEVTFGPQGGGLVPANPFASLAQEGYLHAHPTILGKEKLSEFDAATKGKSLPQRVKK